MEDFFSDIANTLALEGLKSGIAALPMSRECKVILTNDSSNYSLCNLRRVKLWDVHMLYLLSPLTRLLYT